VWQSLLGQALTDLTDSMWRYSLDQNLTSQFVILQAFLKSAKANRQMGSIVLIGSKTAVAPGLGFGAYAIAKAGVIQLARVAALEGGKYGVRVNVVNPGAIFVESNFWTEEVIAERAKLNNVSPKTLEKYYENRNILKKKILPNDVAEMLIFLLSSKSRATTGCILSVDGGDEHAFSR
jgi:NAD(P)-dependent dehydrogenase (short-subunit alcohol dehydrogenase family)